MVSRIKRNLLKFTDERVKFMNEVLQGIRVIKLYAWEDSIAEAISQLRRQELSLLKKMNYIKLINFSIMFVWPVIFVYLGIIVYIYSENDFNIDILFLLLTFMQAARFPISLISNAMNAVAERMVSFG